MGLVVPSALQVDILTDLLTSALSMKLFSNDHDPVIGDTVAAYTEVSGGGYASKPLTIGNWTITPGAPTVALYNANQQWTFTGVTGAPGTIYGYYVVRDSDNELMWAERFPDALVPFVPEAGSKIQVLPKTTLQSQF